MCIYLSRIFTCPWFSLKDARLQSPATLASASQPLDDGCVRKKEWMHEIVQSHSNIGESPQVLVAYSDILGRLNHCLHAVTRTWKGCSKFCAPTHSFGLVRIIKIFIGVCTADLILEPHVSYKVRMVVLKHYATCLQTLYTRILHWIKTSEQLWATLMNDVRFPKVCYTYFPNSFQFDATMFCDSSWHIHVLYMCTSHA